MNIPKIFFLLVASYLYMGACNANGAILPSAEVQAKLVEMFVGDEGDQAGWNVKMKLIDECGSELSSGTPEERRIFLEQMVYFSAYVEAFEKNKATPFAIGYLFKKVSFSDNEILKVSIEHWIGADARLKKAIGEWVQGSTEPQRDSFDNLIPYLESTRNAEGNPSEAAVAYLFDQSPSRAIVTLERLHGGSEKVIAECREELNQLPDLYSGNYSARKVKQDTARQLELVDRMSVDERWWVRLYALSVVKSVKELRPPGLLVRLSKDPHDYVKRAALRVLEDTGPQEE